MADINQREIIMYALIDILDNKKYNNLVLKETLSKNNALNPIQKAFITECVNGTIRNLIHIDYIINYYSKTKTNKMKPVILAILRSGVYQIKFMDKVPPSAVCNEAVNLAKQKGFKNLSGFVNGVLRSISRNQPELNYPDKEKKQIDYLSIKYSVEKWLIKYWLNELSIEEIEELCKYSLKNPSVNICINTLKTTKNNLIKKLKDENIDVSDSGLLENSLQIKKTSDLTKKDSFKNGLYHVMDESSMIAVNTLNLEENKVLIDLCSAPGGKSFFSSYIMNNTGIIYAYDIHEHKITLIEKTSKRLGVKNIKCSINDAEIFDKSKEETADYILIDAPCSGFGMINKKPDIKYTKTFDDIKTLSGLQKRILENSCRYVKKGGTLIYSTCTISKKENLDNVNWFLENFDFEPIDITDTIPEKLYKDTCKHGYIQILPNEYTDGFFISAFRRKGN